MKDYAEVFNEGLDAFRAGTCHPKLSRGIVYCLKCGRWQKVNSAEYLRSGWPKCCGETMTIDARSSGEVMEVER